MHQAAATQNFFETVEYTRLGRFEGTRKSSFLDILSFFFFFFIF